MMGDPCECVDDAIVKGFMKSLDKSFIEGPDGKTHLAQPRNPLWEAAGIEPPQNREDIATVCVHAVHTRLCMYHRVHTVGSIIL